MLLTFPRTLADPTQPGLKPRGLQGSTLRGTSLPVVGLGVELPELVRITLAPAEQTHVAERHVLKTVEIDMPQLLTAHQAAAGVAEERALVGRGSAREKIGVAEWSLDHPSPGLSPLGCQGDPQAASFAPRVHHGG